jgi:hypothetical protein
MWDWFPFAVNETSHGPGARGSRNAWPITHFLDRGSQMTALVLSRQYKQRCVESFTLLLRSSASLDESHPSPSFILKLTLLYCLQWLVELTMIDVPTAEGAIIAHRRPVA